ncbi:MAG: enoyl-CoA hydratase [Myxococcota bacterium]
MTGQIRTELNDHVLELVFDRPDKLNAFTMAMYQALVEGFERAGRDPEVRVVLLSGSGGTFTAGNDITDFMNQPMGGGSDHPTLRFLHHLVDCEKPIVAAVDGPAIGIGTTMLLHCDYVVATRGAKFRMPFVPLGLVPEGGSSVLLPRRIGHAAAGELLLLGDVFSAERAQSLALVNQVVDGGAASLVMSSRAIAQRFAEQPPEALQASKALLRARDRAELHQVIDEEARVFAERLRSPEALEALASFVQRKK